MVCPKCGSNSINVQMVSETQLLTKHRGIFWWICIGWWWLPVKWCCFTVLALIAKILPLVNTKLKLYINLCGYVRPVDTIGRHKEEPDRRILLSGQWLPVQDVTNICCYQVNKL